MEPYQERVMMEIKELTEKIDKLIVLISRSDCPVEGKTKTLLGEQLAYMLLYQSVLEKRIKLF